MIEEQKLTSNQLAKVRSTEGLPIQRNGQRETDDLLYAVGFRSEISHHAGMDFAEIRISAPTEVNVSTIRDQLFHQIKVDTGDVALMLNEEGDAIEALWTRGLDIHVSDGVMTIESPEKALDNKS